MNELAARFEAGRKVRIRGHQAFASGATGTIAYPPGLSAFFDESDERLYRKVRTSEGEKIYVWVIFDEPQDGGDEDGPYVSAELDIENLEVVKE